MTLARIIKQCALLLSRNTPTQVRFLTRALCCFHFVLFIQCATTTASFAMETPSYSLQSNRWEQLVIPAYSDESSIRELFSPALPATDYAISWIIYRFDASANRYVDPGIDGQLAQGTGFWIVQNTGATVVLEIPPTIAQAKTIVDPACTSSLCTRVPVVARAGESTFNMIGSAQSNLVSVGQTRFRGSSVCDSGCSWNQAVAQAYVDAPLWHYNSASNTYADLALTGQISPWQAVWLSTEPALAGIQASRTGYLWSHHERYQCCSPARH